MVREPNGHFKNFRNSISRIQFFLVEIQFDSLFMHETSKLHENSNLSTNITIIAGKTREFDNSIRKKRCFVS